MIASSVVLCNKDDAAFHAGWPREVGVIVDVDNDFRQLDFAFHSRAEASDFLNAAERAGLELSVDTTYATLRRLVALWRDAGKR